MMPGRAQLPEPAEALRDLAMRVGRLAPDRRDPERFHCEKSEVVHTLRCLAEELASPTAPKPVRRRQDGAPSATLSAIRARTTSAGTGRGTQRGDAAVRPAGSGLMPHGQPRQGGPTGRD